jgi:RNA polymerase sigma-70 factor, ECF subfamily
LRPGLAIRPEPPEGPEPTDQDLLKRVAAGDEVAFGQLAERLAPTLRRLVFRLGLTEAEVEDTLQESLIRIWRGSADFAGRSAVSTWACRIALNEGISLLRGRKSRPSPPPPMTIFDTEAAWESRMEAEAVRQAVMALPIRFRTVIVLREFEALPYRAISEILDIPIGTVMSRLHEARARLRRRLLPIM